MSRLERISRKLFDPKPAVSLEPILSYIYTLSIPDATSHISFSMTRLSVEHPEIGLELDTLRVVPHVYFHDSTRLELGFTVRSPATSDESRISVYLTGRNITTMYFDVLLYKESNIHVADVISSTECQLLL